jgi:tRNA(Ile)-lysidine synthase
MKAFCQQIMGPAPDSHPQVQWSGWTIHWFNQSLWLQETTSISPCPEQPWDGAVAAELGPVVGRLAALPTLKFDRELRIGPRRGGERVKLAHHGTRRKVKDLLREAGVPPWLRASIPLLFEHDQVLAVGDQVFCVNLRSFLDKHGVTLRWQASESVLDYVHRHYVSALAVTGG